MVRRKIKFIIGKGRQHWVYLNFNTLRIIQNCTCTLSNIGDVALLNIYRETNNWMILCGIQNKFFAFPRPRVCSHHVLKIWEFISSRFDKNGCYIKKCTVNVTSRVGKQLRFYWQDFPTSIRHYQPSHL